MARDILTPLDMNQLEILQLRLHILASAPGSPVSGQIYFDSVLGYARCWDGSAWIRIDDHWVSAVNVTAPITSTGGATPTIAITAADGSNPGSMSAAHYSLVNGATSSNTASAIVRRDSSGDFTAHDITANKVTGLASPSGSSDAANKGYVDGLVNGLDWKNSVRVATTANGTLATDFANGQTVDGVTLATGDRILLKNQSTASQNGIYVVAASGAPTRATDADSDAEVTGGLAVWVNEGTTNGNTAWILSTDDPITVGSTSLTFTQFAAGTSYSADGTTLTLSGTTFSINTSYVGQVSITTLGTITTGTWSATTIAVNKGGTGATTASGARNNLNAAGIYTTTIGDNSSTSIAITQSTHGLASNGAIVAVVRDASSGEEVLCDITVNNSNGTVTFGFATAPTTNQYRITLLG